MRRPRAEPVYGCSVGFEQGEKLLIDLRLVGPRLSVSALRGVVRRSLRPRGSCAREVRASRVHAGAAGVLRRSRFSGTSGVLSWKIV